jgi:hypothetical protein
MIYRLAGYVKLWLSRCKSSKESLSVAFIYRQAFLLEKPTLSRPM